VGDKKFVLRVGQTTVGRDVSSDIQIPDNGLSRQHFTIKWDGKNAAVKDLGSTNGTRVNGRNITEVALSTDTEIQAGSNVFTFRVTARTVGDSAEVSQ
jgi:pSer/pThr/pTyr-binding forkhead associated (FHA) protein